MTPEFHAPHDPLTRAAIRHGSDKFGGHLYTPVYHALFERLRERDVKLLEIGIGGYDAEFAGGLSLLTWAEYFPYAEITGLDIQKKTLELPPRVRTYQGSQTDLAMLERICAERGPFDIIIDDGSHDPQHMIISFLALYPRMAADGIYVIEDTQTCFHGGLNGQNSIYGLAHQITLAMHKREGYAAAECPEGVFRLGEITRAISHYRNMMVFQRGANTYPANHQLDFNNPEVRAVVAGIEAEAARNPAPGSAHSRIDMLIWAGRHNEAAILARDAAARYPRERALLHELLRQMQRAGQAEAAAEIRLRLAALG